MLFLIHRLTLFKSFEVDGAQSYAQRFLEVSDASACVSYADPHDDFMQMANNMMFAAGAWAAYGTKALNYAPPGTAVNTTTTGYLNGSHEVFDTDLRWYKDQPERA